MIRKRDLGRLEFIARGGVGTVYRVPEFRLPSLPPLAYKELLPGLDPGVRLQVLDGMTWSVAFRTALPPVDREDLDEYSTWPIDMVVDGGILSGLVMPLIPPDFFLDTRPQTGPPKTIVFDLSWLSAKDTQAEVMGVDRSAVQDPLVRVTLLAQLVYAVARLHKHGAVYGDLSLKNVALAVRPPRVKLLDCDAAAALDDPTRVQLHSPFFKPPEMITGAQKLQDDRSDVYKLGLCIIRGLQQGRGISQARDPAPLARYLDVQAVDTITRAIDADPARRPMANELFICLERNLPANLLPARLQGNRSTLFPRSPEDTSRYSAPTSEGRRRLLQAARKRIFLCHASGDKQAVRRLRSQLVFDSMTCWLDEEDLVPGQDWDREIRRAIKDCDIFLACLSTASVTKEGYVQRELRFALDRAEEQPDGMIFIVPVRLEPCTVPGRLSRFHRVDLFRPHGYRQLLRAVR